MGEDGILEDGVGVHPADDHDMELFGFATHDLAHMPVPVFRHSENPHEYLYVAAFDDAWNDAVDDAAHPTNVGWIAEQIELGNSSGRGWVSADVEGVDTEEPWPGRTPDAAIDCACEQRLEKMYGKFIRRAAEWRKRDPDAAIRVVGIGFGRGAELVAGFAGLVHERGIQDWTGIQPGIDDSGSAIVHYARPPLVAPGQVAQAVGLFDPVGTGEPRHQDRWLPPSVISGFQVTADDEHRGPFKPIRLIDQGMTVDGRFLAVMAPGARPDVGGGYRRDGLSIRAGNLMVDYLNALGDAPLLEKRPEPGAAGMNVVHRSEEGVLLHRVWRKVDRQQVSGVVETPAPGHACRIVADCRNAEPRDEDLASRFEYRRTTIGEVPVDTARLDPPLQVDATVPGHPDHALLLQGVAAAGRLEDRLHRVRDLSTDRLAVDLVLSAKRAELQRIDHVVLSDTGSHAFAVEGDLASPFRRLARSDTLAAVSTPVGETLERIGTVALAPTKGHSRTTMQAPASAPEAGAEPMQDRERDGPSRKLAR